jgi:hypothetical protein
MNEFISKNWEVIAGLIGTSSLFFSGLKFKRQNEKTTELENLKTVRGIEKSLLEDMRVQIDELVKLNNYLKGIVEIQTIQIAQYRTQFGELNLKIKENEK